jgi:DNA polymerase III subunit delta'
VTTRRRHGRGGGRRGPRPNPPDGRQFDRRDGTVIPPAPVVPDTPGGRYRTRGQPRAVSAIKAMIAGRLPHAILIGGPSGVGKTTLALDLAAGLLCDDPDPAARPCRGCRGCRLVEKGIHPDLHRLVPTGPGDLIRIGSRSQPEEGTIRRLTLDLALLPVEGGARVAIIERADRMGDDAQTALLKTLEEPGSGVAIVLCADDEDQLMPTVRSRCARIRLGPVGTREIEALLADAGLADPPVAARLARLSGGRPGFARSLARAPDAIATRDEIARSLLDLIERGPAERLVAARDVAKRAASLDGLLAAATDASTDSADGAADGATARIRGRRGRRLTAAGAARMDRSSPAASERTADEGDDEATSADGVAEEPLGRIAAPAAERRRAASILVGLWREVARDLLVVRLGGERDVRDPSLLDDLRGASDRLGVPAERGAGDDAVTRSLAEFLVRLDRAGELLDSNVRAELILDTLVLAWPRAAQEPAAVVERSAPRR